MSSGVSSKLTLGWLLLAQDNVQKMCRQVVTSKLRNAKPEEVVLKFWTVYLEEIVSFDEDPEDWEQNWLNSKKTWE